MTRRMRLCRGRDHTSALAQFTVGPSALGHAVFTEDREGLYIPKLWLDRRLVCRLVAGETLFTALLGCTLCEHDRDRDTARFHQYAWTYAWGDLQLWECGEPMVRRVLLLRGTHAMPDLTRVMRYLREVPKAS